MNALTHATGVPPEELEALNEPIPTPEQIQEMFRAAEKARRRAELASQRDTAARLKAKRERLMSEAPAAVERERELKAALDKAIEAKNAPQKTVDAAEAALLELQRTVHREREAAGLCPLCAMDSTFSRKYIWKCSKCGHDPNSFGIHGFVNLAANGYAPIEAPATVTSAQLAQLLGVSTRTLATMRSEGRCPAPTGLSAGKLLWVRDEVMKWIDAGCPARPKEAVALDLQGE